MYWCCSKVVPKEWSLCQKEGRGREEGGETCRGVQEATCHIGYQVPWYSTWPGGTPCQKVAELWPATGSGRGVLPGGQ
jgi:hypothetical protein